MREQPVISIEDAKRSGGTVLPDHLKSNTSAAAERACVSSVRNGRSARRVILLEARRAESLLERKSTLNDS